MPRVTTSDGVEIAVHDLGGTELGGAGLLSTAPDRPPLVMVHATGLCGQVFEPLAEALAGRFRCLAIDQRGHGRSGRDPGGQYWWPGLALDVLAAVDGMGLQRPVAMGHSCGATALVLAEQQRPGAFGALWCYEPVIFRPGDPDLIPQARALATAARRRREVFASRREALETYAAKAPLSFLAPEALAAYVEGGLEDLPDGRVRLRCRPEDEAVIYERAGSGSQPAWDRLAQVACPVTVACGELSGAFGPAHCQALAGLLPHGRSEVLAGLGHFGPLQDPVTVARAVGSDLGRAVGGEGDDALLR